MNTEVFCLVFVVVKIQSSIPGLSREVVLLSIAELIHFITYSVKIFGVLRTLSMSRHIMSTFHTQGIELDFGEQGVVGGQRAALSQVSSFRTSDFL